MLIFKDRYEAARLLSQQLTQYRDNPDVIVVAIPRGGLELGLVLSQELHAPLDIALTKKIGYPGNPEYAIGAVSLESVVVDARFLESPEMKSYLDTEIKRLRALLQKRYKTYRGTAAPLSLSDKIVIVTDDGVATGHTMAATLDLMRKSNPKRMVIAIPVAAPEAVQLLRQKADEVICLTSPEIFYGVGQFYAHFDQVSDEEAIRLLNEANQ